MTTTTPEESPMSHPAATPICGRPTDTGRCLRAPGHDGVCSARITARHLRFTADGQMWPLPQDVPASRAWSSPMTWSVPRVLVTGSRAWTDAAAVRVALTNAWRDAGRPILVVQGGCPTGADAIAREWAAEHAFAYIAVEEFPADWKTHGRGAGPIRNAEMVAAGAWRCLAFPLGASPGTRGCMALAEKAGIPVIVHEGVPA